MLVKIFKYLSLFYLLGIVLHSFFFPDIRMILFSFGIFILAAIISFFPKRIILIAFALMGFGLGVFHYSLMINDNSKTVLDIFALEKESLVLKGEIVSYPINHESYTSFSLRIDSIVFQGRELPLRTQVQVKTDVYIDYEYGMEIISEGVIEKPKSFETDSGRIFDYDRFLEKDHIYYILPYAETQIISQGNASLQRSLYAIKDRFLDTIYRTIRSPESGLLSGILFGEKSALSSEVEEKFRIVGLMHIVVLSGYNVSIIINIFMKILIFLPRSIRAIFSVGAIILFALLVGAGPTVIRASIMAMFIVLANLVSRPYVVERGLFIAGLIMVIINPKILLFDISFQLSFLATYGLIVLSPWLEKKFKRIPTFLAMRESAVATIAAQIMVVPLILYSIGEFSLISPIVNVLVLFAVPWAMAFGFLNSVVYLLFPVFVRPFSYVATILLEYQLFIVDIFSQIPFAAITVPRFHIIFMFVLYLMIYFWIQKIKKTKNISQS